MTDADGYFSPRDHPQEMVADPSLPQKVLEEEEAAALAAATAASISDSSAGQPADGGGSRRVMMGMDEFMGSERDEGGAGVIGGVGLGEMGDSPPRYTFAPDEAEMVADGYRGEMMMGGVGMGGYGVMGNMGVGGIGMDGMTMEGMGIGMVHVPLEPAMPEAIPMLQTLQASPTRSAHLPQMPQSSPPAPASFVPLMQPLQTPQSMSDRPPETEGHEELICSGCGNNNVEVDLEGRCNCCRRGSVRGGGSCGLGSDKKHNHKHKFRRRIMAVVWGLVLLMAVGGAWTMYHRFRHRGHPGPSWVEWVKKEHHEDKFQCHHAQYSYIGQNVFRFPVDGGNASGTAPSFYLHQRPLNPSHPWRRNHGTKFAGEVVVAGYTPTQPEDEGLVKVEFDISMSREWMKQAIKLEKGKDGNGVTIYTDYKIPIWKEWEHPGHPGRHSHACASIRVLVSIPRGLTDETQKAVTAVLRDLDIDVQSLCITIDHASLDLVVEGNTTLQSFCGDITLAGTREDGPPLDLGERSQLPWTLSGPPHPEHPGAKLDMQALSDVSVGFRTKSLKANTLTGWIHTVPMRRAPGTIEAENTELETTSGHIRVAVVPQLASTEYLDPVNFTIRTISGDVLVDRSPSTNENEALDKFRGTNTYIQTTTGRIVGETFLTNGSLLDVKSFSGDIDLFHVSIPDGTPANPPFLRTETKSGSTRVKVSPVRAQNEYDTYGGDDDEEVLDKSAKNQALQSKFIVRAKHISVSGRIKAVYYPTYEGGFLGRSLSGQVRPTGAGVVLVVPVSDKSYEPEHWDEISSENDDMPIPNPTVWNIVRARKGQKGSGGMVEIQSVTGDVIFFVGERRGWRELLMAAKKKGREWLTKVGCVWWKGKEGKMVSVGVQTEEEGVAEAPTGREEVKGEEQKVDEGKGELEKAGEKTLVETEEGMGKPSEISDTDGATKKEGGQKEEQREEQKEHEEEHEEHEEHEEEDEQESSVDEKVDSVEKK